MANCRYRFYVTVVAVAAMLARIPSSAQVSSGSLNLVRPTAFSSGLAFPDDTSTNAVADENQNEHGGLVSRSIRRGLEDQKQLYAAPFKVRNLKWDVLVLAATGALIATDRRIEHNMPAVNYNHYNTLANVTIGSLGGGLAALWIYGLKTDNQHAKEAGSLELETLANTFLIYMPMQLLAGRQRPGVGNGNGDFWVHHSLNTSFPGGHSMFATAMATTLAHEYPKPWVQVLAYGAAATVTAGRFIGHDHWASDIFVGNVLGYLIASHIFHSRCDPSLSEACH